MQIWEQWKKGFDLWEQKTAALMETVLKAPMVLEPVATALSSAMKLKAATDKVTAHWWSSVGLPTRRDQEKTLHALNQLNSRLLDLEERLEKFEKH